MRDTGQAERGEAALRAARTALAGLAPAPRSKSFKKAVALLASRKGKIVLSGVGKSGAIAAKAAATFTSLGQVAVALDPLSALHGDSGVVLKGDLLIAISFSGESLELVKVARHLAKIAKTPIIALTHDERSALAKIADVVLDIPVEKEGSPHELAPMASTTASLVLCDMLAAALTEPKRFTRAAFAEFHPGGSLGLSLAKVAEVMRPLGETPRVGQSARFGEALAAMTKEASA